MQSKKPQKRIVLPERRTMVDLQMTVSDINADQVLQDALTTAAIEITKYKTKVTRGQQLDLKESRIVQGWIKTMLEIKKDSREEERSSQLEKLSQEELVFLAKKVLLDQPELLNVDTQQPSEDDDDDSRT